MSVEDLIQQTQQEEHTLRFKRFTHDDIFPLGLTLIQEAQKNNVSIAIDITVNGTSMFHYKMPGTTRINGEWIERKKRVVDYHLHSSYFMQLRTARSEMTYNEEHRLDSSFAAFGGSFPIILDGGLIVGMITISGLTPEEDHTIVVNALRTYLNEREVL